MLMTDGQTDKVHSYNPPPTLWRRIKNYHKKDLQEQLSSGLTIGLVIIVSLSLK